MGAIQASTVIKTRLSEKQAEAWRYLEEHPQVKEVLFGGAAGPGKTWFGCLWKIKRRIQYPKTRGLTGRQQYSDLRDSTLKKFLEIWDTFGKHNPFGVSGHYNQQDKTLYFSNGSEELFRHMAYEPSDPNFNRFGSTEFTDLFVDEVQEVEERAWDIAISRIRYNLDLLPIAKPKALCCANPEHNWVKWRFVSDKDHEPVDLKPHQAFVSSLLTDNPNAEFVSTYTENLSGLSNFDQQRLLYGDWTAINTAGNKFYHGFELRDHTGPVEYDLAMPVHVSFDQNVVPYITATLWQVQPTSDGYRLQAFDEFTLAHPRNTTMALCVAIREKYQSKAPQMFLYGDASGNRRDTRSSETDYTIARRELRQFLTNSSDRTERRNPPVLRRRDFINEIFQGKQPGLEIRIGAHLSKTIDDLLNLREDQNGHKLKEKAKDPHTGVSFERLGHTSDTLDYIVTGVFKREFERFCGR